MSPTPVTFGLPTQPASYSWEATDEEVAARFGIPIERDPPVRPQHVARAAGARRRASSPRAPSTRRSPSTRRRTTGRLVETAARRLRRRPRRAPRRRRCRRDPRPRRQGVPAARRPRRRPGPDLRDVPRRDRAARRDRRPRPAPRRRTTATPSTSRATRAAARRRRRSSGCAARTTRPACPSPTARSQTLLDGIAVDARVAGRPPAIVVLDEAYAEFVGASLLDLRLRHPNLVVVRTASKAYALAGLRVGFAIARPETIARIAPYRPPGSVSTVSVTVVTEALADPQRDARRTSPASTPSATAWPTALRDAGWSVGPTRDELPARRLRHDRAGRRRRDGAAPARPRAADVRRRPSAGPLPAPDDPRPGRQRPADRGRARDRGGGRRAATGGRTGPNPRPAR